MCKDLMNQWQHLQRVVDHFTTEQIANNQLQLKASIFIVRYLTFQAVAFRGQDESFSSLNRGNFLESLGIVTFWNEKVAKIIEKAPKNATYTSPRIQKETLHVFSTKVKKAIWEEIGDAKFCIIVDEARDESMKEKMAVVFRYVDAEGFVKEFFFGLIHVVDTVALTLKKGIYYLLSQHCLDIQNIRGQGYDGASNIQGMWNGLQALILNDCPYAYYIHCFAHRLQSALVKVSKQVFPISGFFLKLLFLIKIVNASCKRNEQLKVVNANEIAQTRWSSHFKSVSSLLRMFTSTVEVLLNIIGVEHRAEAESAYDGLTSFEFVFILHLEKETMEITNKLCQALQSKSQDILNSMHLVSSTKALIQKFRDDGWDGLLTTVISFCEKHCIDVLDMNASYDVRQVNILYAAINSQLQERNHRFNEDAMELLRLSSVLKPREALKSFRSSDLCLLVRNFYPQVFTDYDKQVLKKEFYYFEHNVVQDPEFKTLKTF
ncbi:hypothetical protein ACB092_01G259300 [Castanea dentata]